jgi:WD repeat-containing protein 7
VRICTIVPTGEVLGARSKSGRQRLQLTTPTPLVSLPELATRVVWKPRRDAIEKALAKPRITSMLPMELDTIILGHSKPRAIYSTIQPLTSAFQVTAMSHDALSLS